MMLDFNTINFNNFTMDNTTAPFNADYCTAIINDEQYVGHNQPERIVQIS